MNDLSNLSENFRICCSQYVVCFKGRDSSYDACGRSYDVKHILDFLYQI